ncbi:MAG TPA: hypothetical protein VJT31_39680 [Rugosimonospora sp.]|nr:hypothetical protein [Rugosimonospora sp.]
MTSDRLLREELHGMYVEVGFQGPLAWKDAPAVRDDHTLRILGHPVMEDWERPYMAKLAEIAASKGGRVLEIGYGMGISAGFISGNPAVTEHIIVEANRDVARMAEEFARRPENAGRVRIVEGLSWDVVDQLDAESLDGILHDAYPLDESQVQNQAHFAKYAHRLLKPGGVFTYFSDEPLDYRPEHLDMLVDAGFAKDNISYEIVAVRPPDACEYWKSSTILAPIVIK